MEKLELKHIQHYPIGTLKVICPNNCIGVVVSIITTDPFVEIGKDTEPDPVLVRVMYEDGINKPKYDFETLGISQIKPILRPMSDLCKEINGVIGIEEIIKLEFSSIALIKEIVKPTKTSFEYKIKLKDGNYSYTMEIGSTVIKNSEKITGFCFQMNIYNSDNKLIKSLARQEIERYLDDNKFDWRFGLIDKELAIDCNELNKTV